jgi:hypothetical protein
LRLKPKCGRRSVMTDALETAGLPRAGGGNPTAAAPRGGNNGQIGAWRMDVLCSGRCGE